MQRNERAIRLAWFAGVLGLTGLTLAGVGLLAIGSVFLGMLVVGVCATTWWWVLPHLLDVPAVPTSHLRVSARLRQLSQVLRQAGPASSAQLTTTPSLFSIFSIHSPAIGTGGVLVGIGMLLGVLIGVLVARSFATVPAWALAAGAVGLIALAGAGAGVWQLAQSEQRAQAIRIVCWVAFVISLAVYAFTRFANIADFPIYFFSDEAVHTLQAQNLLRNGLSDSAGRFLPPYFANGVYWSLSLTVYVHALGQALFGHSIEIVRATSALFTLFGAAAIGLSTKLAFNQKWWWLGVLFLGATPAWFLHSRTAFETPLMASCYAGFLLFYLLYRARDPRFLLPAIACGALTFYAYTNGQGVMLVTGLLLLISDLRYHLRHKRIALMGLVMIAIVALPYARFRAEQPDAMANQLRILDSYWFLPISFGEKLGRFASEYLHGLSPFYWFLQNNRDLDRHVMKGYGHIAVWALPFWVAGLWVCIRNFKSAMHRVVLIALLAAPFGSAIAAVAVTRALAFVIPSALVCALGAEWLIGLLRERHMRVYAGVAASAALAFATLWMWRDALLNGPTWYTNYGLYSMQWGARQLFEQAVPEYLRQNPDRRLVISPTWTNGTDTVMRFFELDPKDTQRVQLLNIDYYLQRKQVMDSSTTFVMLADEVDRADKSGKFSPILVEKIIPAPDGSPQFTFARLRYADNAESVFAEEDAIKKQPVASTVTINGEPVLLMHSRLDMGTPENILDGDTFTLVRGESTNPFVLDFAFPTPRAVAGIQAVFGRMDFSIKAIVIDANGSQRDYSATYRDVPGEPDIALDFPAAPDTVTRLRLEITQLNPPDEVHIHVREIAIK